MYNIDVEILALLLEQRGAKRPELVGPEPEHGGAGFVDEGAGRVPWLDLLAEDQLEVFGVFGLYEWDDGSVDRVEHLGGELGKGTG